MSPQETQSLQDFLNQLTQVRGIAKDPQAEAMIAAAVAQQPDASYLLVQRALLMDQALAASKAQIASLQSQVQALQSGATSSSSFLDGNAWGHAPAAPAQPRAAAPAYQSPSPPPYQPPYQPAPAPVAQPYQQPAPAQSSGFFGGGMGSMLGTVAATAAGVAGGAFLYQGIEHMFNGSGSGSGLAHQNGLSAPVENIENTTVNNYYGSDGDKRSEHAGNDSSRDSSNNLADSSNNSNSSDDLSDLANFDLDDSGGYDDSMA